MSRPRSHLAPPAVLVAVVFVVACGANSRPQDPHTSAIQPPQDAQLLYVWRNFEETGIPDEMTIYADGEVRYVTRSHGRVGTAADGHLRGPIRSLLLELRSQMDRLRHRSL